MLTMHTDEQKSRSYGTGVAV